MSIIDDYAAIGKAMRELTEPKPKPKPEPVAPKPSGANPWPSCALCGDEGWVAVKRSSVWKGVACPRCGNPTNRKNPIG